MVLFLDNSMHEAHIMLSMSAIFFTNNIFQFYVNRHFCLILNQGVREIFHDKLHPHMHQMIDFSQYFPSDYQCQAYHYGHIPTYYLQQQSPGHCLAFIQFAVSSDTQTTIVRLPLVKYGLQVRFPYWPSGFLMSPVHTYRKTLG